MTSHYKKKWFKLRDRLQKARWQAIKEKVGYEEDGNATAYAMAWNEIKSIEKILEWMNEKIPEKTSSN